MKKLCLAAAAFLGAAFLAAAPVETVISDNFDSAGSGTQKVPADWSLYQQWAKGGTVETTAAAPGSAIVLRDTTDDGEIGISRKFPFEKGRYYRATVKVKRIDPATSGEFFLQLSFFRPGQRPVSAFVTMKPESAGEFRTYTVELQAPEEASAGVVYLFSGRKQTGGILIDDFVLQSSTEPVPPPKGNPRYDFGALEIGDRDLCIPTKLVAAGQPRAAIVIPDRADYRAYAATLNAAIKAGTGIELPVLDDRDFRDLAKLDRNLIVLGSRDTNQAIEKLYRRHQLILDAKYPGKNGFAVRSIHNPFGDKFNVIAAGGSSETGVAKAVSKLAEAIAKHPAGPDLELGYIAEIELPPDNRINANAYLVPVWDSTFGWNRISKNLALFYMTGDTKYAAEFLRLAFPSPETVAELRKDDEDYDDAGDPLVKPYHYRSIRMMLYWDMVEEHPFFTPEMRRKVTQKFYDQLTFWRVYGYQGGYKIFDNPKPHTRLGDRHYLWEALSVYVLADYFDRYYPCFDSREGLRCVGNVFAPLKQSAALRIGTMMWYSTFTEPVITYAALSGDREFEGSPVIKAYGETLLMHTDLTKGDWALSYAGPAYLGQLAMLTGDQAFADLIRLKVPDPDTFRLGQSYWPAKPLPYNSLTDSAGKFVSPAFDAKAMAYPDLPPEIKAGEVRELATYRERADGSGDFLLLDTKYETGGRNPFHNFNISSFRFGREYLLRGYHNQLHIYRDGIGTGRKSFYSKLTDQGKAGSTAFVRAMIPDFNDHDWTRLLLLRDGKFLLAFDTVTPRTDNSRTLIENLWEAPAGGNAKIVGDSDFFIAGRSRIPAKAADVPVSIDSAALLDTVDHGAKYFSGFLGCAGFPGMKPGDKIAIPFDIGQTAKIKLKLFLVGHNALRGKLRISLDGKVTVPEINHLTNGYEIQEASLGTHELKAGKHVIEVEQLTVPEGSTSALISILGVSGVSEDYRPAAAGFRLGTSHPALPDFTEVSPNIGSSGKAMRFTVEAPGRAGKPFTFATLLRPGDAAEPPLAAEHQGQIALKLPEIALLRPYRSGLLLIQPDKLFGFRVDAVPGLFERPDAVAFEYDRVTGKLLICGAGNIVTESMVKDFRFMPERELAAEVEAIFAAKKLPAAEVISAPELAPLWRTRLPGPAGLAVTLQIDGRPCVAVAAGKSVELFDATGKKLRSFAAPDTVGALYFWPGPQLLVLGCKNEKILAYTPDGVKQWEFTSEMAKELVESAKYYWFKSAYPGVYALTGAELAPGEDLLFAGSAGTVEALDAGGKLRGRFWQTWGAVTELSVLPAADGKPVEVLGARMFGGNPDSYVIFADAKGKLIQQSRPMSSSLDGTAMGSFGFSSIGRGATIPVRLEKDGPIRLAGIFNGSQNRLMLWDRQGKPLAEAELGPGKIAVAPRYGLPALAGKNSRELMIADLDGDGKQELVLAYCRNAVIAFDAGLKTRFMTKLPSDPTVLAVLESPAGVRLAAGCAGSLFILDGGGRIVAQAKLEGIPTAIAVNGTQILVATDRGELAAFKL
ncbi:MAG: hypothetical protein AB7F32_05835 [Victivallaceae bacterium]